MTTQRPDNRKAEKPRLAISQPYKGGSDGSHGKEFIRPARLRSQRLIQSQNQCARYRGGHLEPPKDTRLSTSGTGVKEKHVLGWFQILVPLLSMPRYCGRPPSAVFAGKEAARLPSVKSIGLITSSTCPSRGLSVWRFRPPRESHCPAVPQARIGKDADLASHSSEASRDIQTTLTSEDLIRQSKSCVRLASLIPYRSVRWRSTRWISLL